MEATYPHVTTFEKKLYQYNTIEELHKLLNIMLLLTHNGWFYCLCDKYHCCELSCNQVWQLCPLCRIPTYLSGYEEQLDRNQFNLLKSKQFGSKLFPLLTECYHAVKRSLEEFNGHFCDSSRSRYTGQTIEVPLKEQIKFATELKEKNGEKNILIFLFAF